MTLRDDELRALVRESIARVQSRPALDVGGPAVIEVPATTPLARPHASQILFVLPPGDEAGSCLIEPTVRCNHCGYCQTYGH